MPLVVDGDFNVRDSNAAVRYLARKYQVEDHWYPKVTEQQTPKDIIFMILNYPKMIVGSQESGQSGRIPSLAAPQHQGAWINVFSRE